MKTRTLVSQAMAALLTACLFMHASGSLASGMSNEDLLKLAEGKNTMAQRTLGERYAMGIKGLNKDMSQAISWWQKAADNGDAQSQNYLGLIYSKGEAVTQDWVQAHMWFSLAESSKKKTASAMKYKKEAENNRKAAESNMTPEQITTAQVLAQQWLAKQSQ